MAVKQRLEPILDPKFHASSYGYRPKKSALEAIEATKVNCWKQPWVVDLDIKGFFDNVDHGLMPKAVRHHNTCKWTLLYIERWLKAPIEINGDLFQRDKGTPQGSVISPLLANLYLHHAFDDWMRRFHMEVCFERYADDIVIHCRSLKQAEFLLASVQRRLGECKLSLHPGKTKIVYCPSDSRRWGEGFPTSFNFLGFTFMKRTVRAKDGRLFNGVVPGMSHEARCKISEAIRSWRIGKRSDWSLEQISD